MTLGYESLHVMMVAPLPPPRGGIATWVESVRNWISGPGTTHLEVIDSAQHWREIYDVRWWRRILYGLFHGIALMSRFLFKAIWNRPSLVHLTSSGGFGLARDLCVLFVSRVLGLCTVYHLHFGRLPEIEKSGGFERAGFWLTLRMCNTVVVLDSFSASSAVKINPRVQVDVLPNFIDVNSWNPKPVEVTDDQSESNFRILYIGHVIPTKGIRELVQACSALSAKQELNLTLAGPCDPAFREDIEALAGDSDGWLHFAGEVEHEKVPGLMADADVLALPSYTEGFPIVILEAMASSKAIVAARVGAVAEMLAADSDEPCGVVVKSGDIEELASAIEELMKDRLLRQRLGDRARLRVAKEYDQSVVMERLRFLWLQM